MRFLLDVCAASRSLCTMLTDLGHNVVSGAEINPRATDGALLAVANQEQRVLVTEDKDFGELVFVRHLPHPCIIRFVEMQVSEKVAAMRELLEQHADAMHESAMIVVTRRRVRIRLGKRNEQGTN